MTDQSTGNGSELVYLPLGGAGEIGMNVYLYGHGAEGDRKWLMLDLGITFPGPQEPGVDVILPDLRFIEDERDNLVALVLTHAHEDHFGAVLDLWPRLRVPIYATPFTVALLKAKMAEFSGINDLPLHEVREGVPFDVGPFNLELIHVAHSIPEPNAVYIKTEAGRILHTGDWKLDTDPVVGGATDLQRIEEIGNDGIDVLICDSTNVFRDGISPSERQVADSLTEIIKAQTKRVAVTTFASNVARIKSIGDAATAAGRELVVVGRAMHRVIQVAKDTGQLPQNFRYFEQDHFSQFSRSEIVVLCTGSQGEQRAAMARVAEDRHPHVKLVPGDTVIFSSRTIPGNEKSVSWIQNGLADRGVNLITDSEALVHVTGHPRRGELENMYKLVRPACLVPMHGEIRHLEAQRRFALEQGIKSAIAPRNGEMLQLCPGPPKIIDEAPVGRLYRDGRLILDGQDRSIRDRRKLSFVGIVVVSIVMARNGDLLAETDVILDGIPEEDSTGYPMDDRVLDAVDGALVSIPKARRKNADVVEEAARRAARSAVWQAWGKKPICKVMVAVI